MAFNITDYEAVLGKDLVRSIKSMLDGRRQGLEVGAFRANKVIAAQSLQSRSFARMRLDPLLELVVGLVQS